MDFTAARNKMVDNQIRTTDVTSHAILEAFLVVPRESFVPDQLKPLSYIDDDLEIAPGRYLMEPSPLAKLIQLAEIRPDDAVLEIGAGTGYASVVMAQLAASVVALESDAGLVEQAKANVSAAGAGNVLVVAGPLASGMAAKGPYNVILFNGAVETVPEALFAQLADGGRLVVVVGRGLSSSARIFVRERGAQSERFAFNAAVKMLPGFEKTVEFQF